MILGRCVFGIGCETMWVVQMVYIASWFYDLELALAMGVSGSLSNVASFASGVFVPKVYAKQKILGDAFFGGTVFCFVSFIVAIILAILDRNTFKSDAKLTEEIIQLQ